MQLPLLAVAGLVLCFHSTPARADARANVNFSGQTFSSPQGAGSARVEFEAGAAQGELAVTGRKKKWKLRLSRRILRDFDFFPDEDGNLLVAWLKSSYVGGIEAFDSDPECLIFFKDGKISRSYAYSELLKDPGKAWRSVSHTHWLFEPTQVDLDGGTVTLATNDGHRYRFSLPDGALVSTERFDPEAEKKKPEAKAPVDPTQTRYPAWHFSKMSAELVDGKLAFKPDEGTGVLISLVHGYDLENRRPEKWVIVLVHGASPRAYLDSGTAWTEARAPTPVSYEKTRFTIELEKPGAQRLKLKDNPVTELAGEPKVTLRPVLEAAGILDKADISPYL